MDDGWIGNPYALSDGYSCEESISRIREDFHERLEHETLREVAEDLRGKTPACYCKPKVCHTDVILEYLR